MDECKPLAVGRHRGAQAHGVLQRAAAVEPHLRQGQHGRLVLVDPIKPTLTDPGPKRLKPRYDKPLSSFAFNFNLRRYNMGIREGGFVKQKAGWCRLPVSNPVLTAPWFQRLKL